MQTWLLYIVYGTYASDPAHFETAKQMLRKFVDVRTYLQKVNNIR